MEILDFDGRNVVMGADQPEYLPLYAFRHVDAEGTVTSCWGLTFRERLRVLFGGNIYFSLMTFGGSIQPQNASLDSPV